MILIALAAVVGWVGYMYMQSLLDSNTVYVANHASTTTPEVVVQVEYKERYDEMVQQILAKEKEMWETRARLSAERQASEELAKQFEEIANQKRLEEQSL